VDAINNEKVKVNWKENDGEDVVYFNYQLVNVQKASG
jgi:hypothetical protein